MTNERLAIYKNILHFLSTGKFSLSFVEMGELSKAIQLIQTEIKTMETPNDNSNITDSRPSPELA